MISYKRDKERLLIHSWKIWIILLVLWLLNQLIISGKNNKDKHPENIEFIYSTLLISHLDISGKYNNEEQSENIKFI